MLILQDFYLTELKFTDCKLCTFCKLEVKTIEHLFVDCFYVKKLCVQWKICSWKDLIYLLPWQNQYSLRKIKHMQYMYKIEKLLILVIYYFFTCRNQFTNTLNIDVLSRLITEKIYVEKYLLLRNGEYAQYVKHRGKYATFLIINEQN